MAGEVNLVDSKNVGQWRAVLSLFDRVDVCQFPEYHNVYLTRARGARACLWCFSLEGECFAYPFFLTPVSFESADGRSLPMDYFDISSAYGYTGPLSTSQEREFLNAAWDAFDHWAKNSSIVAEFIRFSPYVRNERMAHRLTRVELNREISYSLLPQDDELLLEKLPSKTRNMVRKAVKAGMEARKLEPRVHLSLFAELYHQTMDRNNAPGFFLYDQDYFEELMKIPDEEILLIGVFCDDRLVSSSIFLQHGKGALYHLGASLSEFARNGAGNLALYEGSRMLIRQGVEQLNLGGGRTTASDDPLLKFKKSNGLGTSEFFIGKRVIHSEGYEEIRRRWHSERGDDPDMNKVLFYR